MLLLGGLLIFCWSSPARVSLFSNRRKMAEKGRRCKMKNQRFSFKNLFTKAMKEEIENKNSQELSGLSVCTLFPLKHWKCSSLPEAFCPVLWAVWGITNAIWLPAQLQNKKENESWKEFSKHKSSTPRSVAAIDIQSPRTGSPLQGIFLVEIWFSLYSWIQKHAVFFPWARKHVCFCIPSS